MICLNIEASLDASRLLKIMKIILLLISFLGAIQAKDPLALCSSQTEFDFESITFSPPAPVVGKDLIVRASGALKVAVTPGSQFKLVLKFGPIKVFEKSSYVCNPDSTTDCWIPGHYNDLEAIFPIPGNVPLVNLSVLIL